MAGKPGRSGGARPGAGRPRKEPDVLALFETYDDPLEFLKAVMNDKAASAQMRVDAAKAMLPYKHNKLGEGGKKDQQQQAAKKAGNGKFGSAPPPLRVIGGGKE